MVLAMYLSSVRMCLPWAQAPSQAIAGGHGLHAWSFRTERALRDLDAAGSVGAPEPTATPHHYTSVDGAITYLEVRFNVPVTE